MSNVTMDQWMIDFGHVSPVIYGLDRRLRTTWEKATPQRSGPGTEMAGRTLDAMIELVLPLLSTEYYDINIFNAIKDDLRIRRPDGKRYTDWTIRHHIRMMREEFEIPLPPKPESKNSVAILKLIKDGKSKKEIMDKLKISHSYYNALTGAARKKGLI